MVGEIRDLGVRSGELLFFGGVYSNLQALEALKIVAEEREILPENIFCTGDIIGYCAQPLLCLQYIQDWGIQTIIGNVEQQLRDDADHCGCEFEKGTICDLLSKNWYAFAKSKMNTQAINFLEKLPAYIKFEYEDRKVGLVHGSTQNISEFLFDFSPWEFKQPSFDFLEVDTIIAGHCGLPFLDQKKSKEKNYTWLNPGVIGMPRNDGKPTVHYALMKGHDITIERLAYDHQKAYQLMLANHLPKEYANTLLTGYWDNEDVINAAKHRLGFTCK